ncbi:MAG: hypothetical protein M1812_001171 [Candelaria pacifica]|nr:MAG: hypothetical protein M1812_001171 [Candelaria pacifica]
MAPGRGRRRAQAQGGSSRQVSEGSRQRRRTAVPSRGPSPSVRRSRRLSSRSSLEADDPSRSRSTQPIAATIEDLDSRRTQAEAARRRQREQTREDRVVEERNEPQVEEPAISEREATAPDMSHAVASESLHHEVDVQASEYDLAIIVQPPAEARPRQVLAPPITTRLNFMGIDAGNDSATHEQGFYAVASMMDENGMVPLAPPSTVLLVGTLVATVQALSLEGQHTEGEENIILGSPAHGSSNAGTSCVWFNDLTVTQMGRYRIRVSLMSSVSSGADAVTLQTVDSRIIHIRSGPSAGEPTAEEQLVIEQLQRHQTVTRSPDP